MAFQPDKISPEQLQEEAIKAHKKIYAFRNWWSNVPLTGWGTVLYRGMGWWITRRWEQQNRLFRPELKQYPGKEVENTSFVSRLAYKHKKFSPLQDGPMQIHLAKRL